MSNLYLTSYHLLNCCFSLIYFSRPSESGHGKYILACRHSGKTFIVSPEMVCEELCRLRFHTHHFNPRRAMTSPTAVFERIIVWLKNLGSWTSNQNCYRMYWVLHSSDLYHAFYIRPVLREILSSDYFYYLSTPDLWSELARHSLAPYKEYVDLIPCFLNNCHAAKTWPLLCHKRGGNRISIRVCVRELSCKRMFESCGRVVGKVYDLVLNKIACELADQGIESWGDDRGLSTVAIREIHEITTLAPRLRESSHLITVSLTKHPLAVVSKDKLVSRINS